MITRTYSAPFENGRFRWCFEVKTKRRGFRASRFTYSGFQSEAEALAKIETLKQEDSARDR